MKRFVGSVVALALVAASSGCASQEPYHSDYENVEVRVQLDAPPSADMAAVEAAWADLWSGMAADPESQALIRRLFSGLPVKLEAAPAGPAPTTEDAPEELRVRVSDMGLPRVKRGYTPDPAPPTLGVSAIRDVRLQIVGPPGVVLHHDAPATSEPTQAELADAMVDVWFADLEVLRLAAAEYLGRKLGGEWTLSDPIEERVERFCKAFRWSLEAD